MARQPVVAGGVDGHFFGVEDEMQVRADSVGNTGCERCVEPELVGQGEAGGVLDARGDRQVAPASRQVHRDGGADAVAGGRVLQRDGDARRGGGDLVVPRFPPLVAVLFHRQAPLDASDR